MPERVGLPIGAVFTIVANITDVTNLYAFDATMTYDSSILHGINVTVGPYFSGGLVFRTRINDTESKLQVIVTLTGDQAPLTGSGILFQASFRVMGVGSAPFDIIDDQLALADSSVPPQQIIPSMIIDGAFDNRPPDVAVSSVSASPELVLQGEIVGVTAVIVNHGNMTETFSVTTYYGNSIIETKSAANLPPDASQSLLFQWNTSQVAPGIYRIRAVADQVPSETHTSDNEGLSQNVTVRRTNSPPLVSPIGAQTVEQGKLLNFAVQASDPDGDPLTFDLAQAPTGARINATTGVFSWTPDSVQGPGTYSVRINVSDGIAVTYEDVTVNVTAPPAQPTSPTSSLTQYFPWAGLGLVAVVALALTFRYRRKK